jgi:hypothetical protein
VTFRSFDEFAEAVVLPARAANPAWVRLDGGGYSNWDVSGVFEHPHAIDAFSAR